MAEEKERIYVIPLKNANYNSSRAADIAVKRVKKYLTKHMKVEMKDIWIDESLNRALWSHGKYSMSGHIRVKAVKFDDGVVEASLPELEFKKSRREILREEREKKTPVLRKEAEMPSDEEEEGIEDDYEMVPGPDGEMKLKKKKKSSKKEKESKEKSEEIAEEKPKKKEEKPEEKEKEEPSKSSGKTKKTEEKKEKPAKPKKDESSDGKKTASSKKKDDSSKKSKKTEKKDKGSDDSKVKDSSDSKKESASKKTKK